MSNTKAFDFAVIGGDARQIYMIGALIEQKYRIICAGLEHTALPSCVQKAHSLQDAAAGSDVLLCPVPLSKNGTDITVTGCTLPDATADALIDALTGSHTLISAAIPPQVAEHCKNIGCACYDLMQRDDVAIHNAVATAEGTLAELILRGTGNLHQSRVLIIGFGRCAQVLAAKLLGLAMHVTVCARNHSARALAQALGYEAIDFSQLDGELSSFAYVVNTVPAHILTHTRVALLDDEAVVIDIATSPGGVDFKAAAQLHKNCVLCPGLPGRYAPKTSGEIIANAVLAILSEGSD